MPVTTEHHRQRKENYSLRLSNIKYTKTDTNCQRVYYSLAGLSDIKGVCTYYRASINQDRGPFPTSLTITHELGHRYANDFIAKCKRHAQELLRIIQIKAKHGVLYIEEYKNMTKICIYRFIQQSSNHCKMFWQFGNLTNVI